MKVYLFPSAGQDYLDPEEIAKRLTVSIPNTVVDWNSGDRMLEKKLDELLAAGAPDVIIESHKSLFGRTAYIDILFPQFIGKHVHFLVAPYGRIQLESRNPEDFAVLEHASRQLSLILNYEFKIAEA